MYNLTSSWVWPLGSPSKYTSNLMDQGRAETSKRFVVVRTWMMKTAWSLMIITTPSCSTLHSMEVYCMNRFAQVDSMEESNCEATSDSWWSGFYKNLSHTCEREDSPPSPKCSSPPSHHYRRVKNLIDAHRSALGTDHWSVHHFYHKIEATDLIIRAKNESTI